MQTSSKLKKVFIKKWVKGLEICCYSNKNMNAIERKKKIKLCADIALASAKNATTSWSNALIFEAKQDEESKILVNNLLGRRELKRFKPQNTNHHMIKYHKRVRSKKILKKSRSVSQRMKKMGPPKSNLAIFIAKRLVKKRTQVLKKLVPGGESMDELSLIREALDYILSLEVQVDVMRSVANATEVSIQSCLEILNVKQKIETCVLIGTYCRVLNYVKKSNG
ncbi:transcription factor IBH1-like 1 [Rutidosis leptorrhynchoides]|uniref:transcription factor IBH1-like 1 n=1 Tax=Rutidosis leptorrhynchoides TaxID=125765 RepID=UPI003A990403